MPHAETKMTMEVRHSVVYPKHIEKRAEMVTTIDVR
jgi:hypothetical protein